MTGHSSSGQNMSEAVEQAEVVTAETPAAEIPQGESDVKVESSTAPEGAEPEKSTRRDKGRFRKRIQTLTDRVNEQDAVIAELKAKKPEVTSDERPKRDDFDDFELYQEAIATHTAKQVIAEDRQAQEAERRTRQAQTDQATRSQQWDTHVDSASEKYDDGDDVMSHFMSTVSLHPYALEAIIESDAGSELAYYLGKNEQEATRIAKLTPPRQALEVGKLEAKLADAQKKVSAAPEPIDPVAGKGSASTGLSDSLPLREWMKRRNKQVRG